MVRAKYKKILSVGILVLALTVLGGPVAWPSILGELSAQINAAQIEPGMGVEFQQVDFVFTEVFLLDSNWGRATADPMVLAESTGIEEGFLNVFTDYGWPVVDLPLSIYDGLGPITTYFNLGLSVPSQDVTVLYAYVTYSREPYTGYQEGPLIGFPVGTAVWDAEGAGGFTTEIGEPPPAPFRPSPRKIVLYALLNVSASSVMQCFPMAVANSLQYLGKSCGLEFPLVESNIYILPNTANVDAAKMQCFPMAVANSLQYLEDYYGLSVPHNHVKGLRGDDSLVGQLDTESNRPVISRREGSGVWFTPMLQGKFSYLIKNGLKNRLVHRHQGRGWGNPGNHALPDGDFTSSGITSTDNGATVTWEWICEQIEDGGGIELVFSFDDGNGDPTGGHAVRVIGYERNILGIYHIWYVHDSNQSDDSDGCETVYQSVWDTDGDGILNLGSKDWEIRFVLSESIAPSVPTTPPGTTEPPETPDGEDTGGCQAVVIIVTAILTAIFLRRGKTVPQPQMEEKPT